MKLENFAARLTTGRWKESGNVLKRELGWPLLRQRRRFQTLCLVQRILTSGSLIPNSTFSPHLAPNLHHLNTCPLQQPFTSTNYFHYLSLWTLFLSFFVDVVPLWNSLPDNLVSLSSNLAFKRSIIYIKVV